MPALFMAHTGSIPGTICGHAGNHQVLSPEHHRVWAPAPPQLPRKTEKEKSLRITDQVICMKISTGTVVPMFRL